jgi:uncharacterized phage-like protein YoqJ
MYTGFSKIQKENFSRILKNADTVIYASEKYTPGCYRKMKRYMVERSDYLIAVAQAAEPGAHMIMIIARKKGIEIVIIDLIKYIYKGEEGK